jgi:hypothetical protein
MFGDGALGYRLPDEPLSQSWLKAFAHGSKAFLVQGGFSQRWSFVKVLCLHSDNLIGSFQLHGDHIYATTHAGAPKYRVVRTSLTDDEIGRRLGRDKSTVGERRRHLGIPPKVPDWTPQEIKLLGTVPDRQLAQRLGRTLFSIQNRRLKLGIPPAVNPKYRPWTEQEMRLLGTMPDADLALKIGRPYEAVRDKRNQHHIDYEHPRYAWWKPEELALLAKYSNEGVAKMTGRYDVEYYTVKYAAADGAIL